MIEELRENGIVVLPPLSPTQVLDIQYDLGRREVYKGHVKRGVGELAIIGDAITCWSMQDVILAPHIWELGLSYMSIAKEYLGQDPYLYSFNAFTTRPTSARPDPYLQEFHRDHDDDKFLALFIYLSDVIYPQDGVHDYVLTSHRTSGKDCEIECVHGKAGTMFLEDGRGLHRGIQPTTGARTILWIRWGISCPPRTYVQDGIVPIDAKLLGDRFLDDPYIRERVKLVTK